MVILGLLVRTSIKLIIIIGFIIFLGHDILDYMQLPQQGTGHFLMSILFTAFGTQLQINQTHFVYDLYAIIPWTGVMLLGYGFGTVYKMPDAVKRRRTNKSVRA